MKDNIHPPYQEVLFVDSSTGFAFVCGSTMQPKETETFEGKTYPVVRLATSSASHPFFTKSKQFVDAEGRVDKFNKRYTAKTVQVSENSAESAEKKKDDKKPKRPRKKT